jgi:hypothetical protein
MKLSFTPVYRRNPCIFLLIFLLCNLVNGYYDQAYDSTAFQGYGYFSLNDDSNDLDLQKHKIRHSDPCINCIVLNDAYKFIVYRIILEEPIHEASSNLLTNAYRAPPEKSS